MHYNFKTIFVNAHIYNFTVLSVIIRFPCQVNGTVVLVKLMAWCWIYHTSRLMITQFPDLLYWAMEYIHLYIYVESSNWTEFFGFHQNPDTAFVTLFFTWDDSRVAIPWAKYLVKYLFDTFLHRKFFPANLNFWENALIKCIERPHTTYFFVILVFSWH